MLFGIADGVSEELDGTTLLEDFPSGLAEELDGVTESEDSPPRLLSELGVLPSSGVLLELGATEELEGSTEELDGVTELEDCCSGVLSGSSDRSSSSFSSSS
jgi:hypothetical protein